MDEMCEFEWIGPFWGGEPGVDEHHECALWEGHDGSHRCDCGESMNRVNRSLACRDQNDAGSCRSYLLG